MDSREFGRLVAALRKEHSDERGPGRGTPWTQTRLAQEMGVPSKLVGDIEVGERRHIDAPTLELLAKALNLTSRERREFFLLASGMGGEQAARR